MSARTGDPAVLDATRLAVGTVVLIEDLGLACHYRTPLYVRGRTGEVIRYCGRFPNPEALAYGDRAAPPLELYRVRLKQADLWPEYEGGPDDVLEIEVYRHWLRPLGEAA